VNEDKGAGSHESDKSESINELENLSDEDEDYSEEVSEK